MSEPAAPIPDSPRAKALTIAAIAAGPAAWIVQLLVGYGLGSLLCFPSDAPRPTATPWSGETPTLIAVNLACLALSGLGGAYSLAKRRAVGPGAHRARFLCTCGAIASGIFILAILFDTPVILATPACWDFVA